MGVGASHQTKLEREFGDIGDGDGQERFFGLENFGNTCYCNSVLQALYFCEPLRHHLAQVREEDTSGGGSRDGSSSGGGGGSGGSGKTVLSELAELFSSISNQKRRSGHLAPTEFLRTLRERNELFRGNRQQDAHEFFNFVLNEMADSVVARRKLREEAATVQEHKQRFQQNGSHHHRQTHGSNGNTQTNSSQQQQQQDPRRSSTWSKMSSFKGSFGNGLKNASQPASAEGAAAAATPSVAPAADCTAPSAAVGGHAGGMSGSDPGEGESAAGVDGGGGNTRGNRRTSDGANESGGETWVHRIFQGVLTNQTKCLCCETVSNRDEPFMDLSLDVEQNSSVSACLRNFSSTETLTKKNKFFCETCYALQEAEKKIRLKRLPRVLTLHLKRFKYVESLENFSKLSHRVVFPLELRTPNMTDAAGEADADGRLYRQASSCISLVFHALFAVVVHIGRGPNHGHYVAVVKSGGRWLLFDDEIVELVNEQVLKQCFGLARPASAATNTGYLLLYDCGE
ncbi:unnamed protein product [Ectocarpus sp. 6 AP-2014]